MKTVALFDALSTHRVSQAALFCRPGGPTPSKPSFGSVQLLSRPEGVTLILDQDSLQRGSRTITRDGHIQKTPKAMQTALDAMRHQLQETSQTLMTPLTADLPSALMPIPAIQQQRQAPPAQGLGSWLRKALTTFRDALLWPFNRPSHPTQAKTNPESLPLSPLSGLPTLPTPPLQGLHRVPLNTFLEQAEQLHQMAQSVIHSAPIPKSDRQRLAQGSYTSTFVYHNLGGRPQQAFSVSIPYQSGGVL